MSWLIDELTLPVKPYKVKAKPAQKIKGVNLLKTMPLLLPFGPETFVITLEGWLYEVGKTINDIRNDYLAKLKLKALKPSAFPVVIADDDQFAFWVAAQTGSGSLGLPTLSNEPVIKVKGDDALKVVVPAGSSQWSFIKHAYSPARDFSKQQFLSYRLYGLNNAGQIRLTWITDTPDYFSKIFTDDFTGWQRKVFRKDEFTKVGNGDWSSIDQVEIMWSTVGTRYVDRTCVGVGVIIVGPGTLYDGIYILRMSPWEEKKGYPNAIPYKLELWSCDDWY